MTHTGLAPQTAAIFDKLSQLECIKEYTLVGGTALSLQLGTRQSEDLDFMSWRKTKNEPREVNWPLIMEELQSIGTIQSHDILDLDHVEFLVDGVKISFYANPNFSPVEQEVAILNNIKAADPQSIGAMKLEVMLRRSKFRDYYDIYSLIEAGIDLNNMIEAALRYSRHRLKSKNILALLTRSERFVKDSSFSALNPVYSVTAADIEQRIKSALSTPQNEKS